MAFKRIPTISEMAAAVLLGGLAATSAHSQNVEEQVITGTILRGNVTAVSPIATIDGVDLQEAPQITLNDYFVTYFTPNASLNTTEQTDARGGGLRGNRAASLDLRGLGEENTLILINGVRTVEYAAPDADGWRAVDINGTIPGIAVRRTDVLLDGGSAIYGTDAVAGVVNFIPDYDFRGAKINLSGNADENDWGYIDYNLGVMWGGGNDTTNIVIAYEQAKTNPAAIGQSNNADREGDWSNPQPGQPIYDGADFAPEHNWYPAAPGETAASIDAWLYNPAGMYPGYPDGLPAPGTVTNTYFNGTIAAVGATDPSQWDYLETYQDWYNASTSSQCSRNGLEPDTLIDMGTGLPRIDSRCGELTQLIFDWGLVAERSFVDPLCGRGDVFGREQIFVGNTRDQFGGETFENPDTYGCLWYDRPGTLEIENAGERDNQVALVAIQHEFTDTLKWAGEFSWSENVNTDFREYFPDSNRSVRLVEDNPVFGFSYQNLASTGATFTGKDVDGNVVSEVYVPNWVVEWDHPGVEYNRDLWEQYCADAGEYCYGAGSFAGLNPWDPGSGFYSQANGFSKVPAGVFPADFNAYPFDNHSTRTNTATMYRFGNSLTWQISDNWSALFGGVIAQNEVENRLDDLVPERLALALKGLGGASCGVTIEEYAADPDGFDDVKGQGDCYYWNPFMNAMAPDASDYGAQNNTSVQRWMTGPAVSTYTSDFWALNASVSGVIESIDIGAGPLAIAFGAEMRNDELSVDFDALQEQARYIDIQSGDAYVDYTGKTETMAALVDSSLPITDSLTIQATGRVENVKAGGLNYDSFTPKLGFNWQALDSLTFRGAWGTSFRAPTVNHLFGREGRASTTVDLWEDAALSEYRQSAGNLRTYDPSDVQLNDPTDLYDVRREGVPTVLSPNPNLQPQEGEAISFGLTWDLTDNLRLTLGYVDISFENSISSANVAYAKILCGEPETFTDYARDESGAISYTWYRPTFDGRADEVCFGLDENGFVDKFYDTYYNVGSENSRAIDFSLDYSVMTDFGQFSIRPNGTWNLERSIQDLTTGNLNIDTVAIDITGVSGNGIPEYRMNLPLSWTYGRHSATVTGRWTSAIRDGSLCLNADGCPADSNTPALEYGQVTFDTDTTGDQDYITADFRYSYKITDSISVAATVTNIVNTQPDDNATSFPNDLRRFGLQFNMTLGGE